MTNPEPTVLPLLRSDNLGKIAAVIVFTKAPVSVAEISRATGLHTSIVSRTLRDLRMSGLLLETHVGRTKQISGNTASPLWQPFAQLITIAYGPTHLLATHIPPAGVEKIVLFGSWAARFHGHSGPPPNDIDVAIIGIDIDRDDIADACDAVQRLLHREVNYHVFTPQRWNTPDTPLLTTIKTQPMVEVEAVGVH